PARRLGVRVDRPADPIGLRRSMRRCLFVLIAITLIGVFAAQGAPVRTTIARINSVAWSPTGKEIAFTAFDEWDTSSVYTIPAAGGRPTKIFTPDYGAEGVVWAPARQPIVLSNVSLIEITERPNANNGYVIGPGGFLEQKRS